MNNVQLNIRGGAMFAVLMLVGMLMPSIAEAAESNWRSQLLSAKQSLGERMPSRDELASMLASRYGVILSTGVLGAVLLTLWWRGFFGKPKEIDSKMEFKTRLESFMQGLQTSNGFTAFRRFLIENAFAEAIHEESSPQEIVDFLMQYAQDVAPLFNMMSKFQDSLAETSSLYRIVGDFIKFLGDRLVTPLKEKKMMISREHEIKTMREQISAEKQQEIGQEERTPKKNVRTFLTGLSERDFLALVQHFRTLFNNPLLTDQDVLDYLEHYDAYPEAVYQKIAQFMQALNISPEGQKTTQAFLRILEREIPESTESFRSEEKREVSLGEEQPARFEDMVEVLLGGLSEEDMRLLRNYLERKGKFKQDLATSLKAYGSDLKSLMNVIESVMGTYASKLTRLGHDALDEFLSFLEKQMKQAESEYEAGESGELGEG